MSKQVINLGASANDGTGDPARSAFTKTNANFSEIYQYLGDGSTLNKLGTAASKNTGTSAGNVMEVGAFGLGNGIVAGIEMARIGVFGPADVLSNLVNENKANDKSYYFVRNGAVPDVFPDNYGSLFGFICSDNTYLYSWQFFTGYSLGSIYWRRAISAGSWSPWAKILNDKITTTDSNGFIKAASPVVKLFAEKIEPNEEVLEQEPVFEKVNVGHYLLKNTEGFSDDGWYIEMPKDANGNVLVAVQYQQLEDNTIELKTFAKKFDEETGDILPNLEKPRDIPVGRWIDIRLKALPQPQVETSNTPPDFQPTNLAQAVAEALKNDTE
ncbi:pyocin knob domain-containing protein [Acinetobacter bereziniae]|uniref:pyocin knob domain-containing protein n=1 Tax=Acinetobacter bereziniae TaxID=106648 RepID=UPI000C2C5229|nr:pyocin knob domain-containing protein [Acinetobacter bereziniae]ATZ64239.1 hypothetical protein BSR55_13115 [Acinetobacter bereziniae]